MRVEQEIIQAFLQDTPMTHCRYFPYLEDFTPPSRKRKDVCEELLSQLETFVEEFPVFNQPLWSQLFQPWEKDIVILPVVGTKHHRIQKEEDRILIFLDFIVIADITPIISRMLYVMSNYLTLELSRIAIHQQYPFTCSSYQEMLDYITFVNGLANYLAWNKDVKEYKFYTEKYEPYKEKSFGMLYSAYEVEQKVLQHKILRQATHGEFWDQFPSVAGMFYFDDIYRTYGIKGIVAFYQKGPDQFVHHIFHTV